jgi:hypothetical protein
VYATSDGTVYRRDANGKWSSNNGNGWKPTARPAAQGGVASERSTGGYQQQQNLEYQAQARQFGNDRVEQTRQFQPARRGGGGRRR